MVAVDIDKLNQIFADDWATVGPRARFTPDFKSGKTNWSGLKMDGRTRRFSGNAAAILVASLFGWISSRSALASGWCAA